MKSGKRQVSVSVSVNYRRYRNRKDRQRCGKSCCSPPGVCTPHPPPSASTTAAVRHRNQLSANAAGPHLYLHAQPRLRLFFLAVALILRNLWVWIHQTRLADGSGDDLTLHLEPCVSNECSTGSCTRSLLYSTTAQHLASYGRRRSNLELLNE